MDINSQKNIGIHVSRLMRISLGSFLSDSADERDVAKSRIKQTAASIDFGTCRFRCNVLRSLNKVGARVWIIGRVYRASFSHRRS